MSMLTQEPSNSVLSGEVLSDQDITMHAAMRSPLHLVGMIFFCLFFGGLSFYPPAGAMLGVQGIHTFVWGVSYAIVFACAYFAFHLDAGKSARYRAIHRLETVIAGLGAATLIAISTRPDTLLWVLLFSLAYQSGTVGTNRRFTAGAIALAGISAATSRILRGDVAAGLIGFALTSSATGIYLMLSAAAKHLATVVADREALQQRVAELEVQAERVRIARDLHDGLGTELSALVWTARMVEERVTDEATKAEVAQFCDRIRFGMQELRSIVWGLRGNDRTLGELAQHLGSRCSEIAGATTMHYQSRITDPQRVIPADIAVNFVRIVQEAVRNAARHAQAKTIVVDFHCDDRLHSTIADDGMGIASERLSMREGGVANMRSRAERAGGEVVISSEPGATRVDVQLPVARR